MADISSDLAALSLHDRLEKAVKESEQKQQESNRHWLEAEVLKSEDEDPAKQQEKKDELARKFKFDSWGSLESKHGVKEPRDLLTLTTDIGQLDKGTRPPVPKQERDDFLSKLLDRINVVYDQDDPSYKPTSLPEEYVALLSITDGIRDNDLRGAGVAGLPGIQQSNIMDMTEDMTERLPLGNDTWRKGWELSTGFVLEDTGPANVFVYFYCKRCEEPYRGDQKKKKLTVDTITDSEHEWKWRLFYMEPMRNELEKEHQIGLRVFEGIASWLQVYQEWWHRESVVYPAWRARMAAEFDLMHGSVSDDYDDDDDSQMGDLCACGEDGCDGLQCDSGYQGYMAGLEGRA